MKKSRILVVFTLLAGVPAEAMQVNELVARYRLDELSGTAMLDDSGNGLDGTYMGTVTLAQPGAAPGTGFAVDFNDATNARGAVPNAAPLSDLRENLSVVAWVNPRSYGPTGITRVFGNNLSAWSAGIRSAGLRFTTTGILDYDISFAGVPLDEWTHLAYVFDANHDVTFFVNGVAIPVVVPGSSMSGVPSAEWLVGGGFTVGLEQWDGLLDDIQVYDGSLTAEEVLFLFQNPGTAIGAEIGTRFCFGDGQATFCPCGNNNDGTTDLGQAGCANSAFFGGAALAAFGTSSLAEANLVLTAESARPGQPGLMFSADNAINGGDGNPFGDGLRCAGGNIDRLQILVPNASGVASTTVDIAALTGVSAGDVRRMQFWYRDPGAGCTGADFNLSNGVEVTYEP